MYKVIIEEKRCRKRTKIVPNFNFFIIQQAFWGGGCTAPVVFQLPIWNEFEKWARDTPCEMTTIADITN